MALAGGEHPQSLSSALSQSFDPLGQVGLGGEGSTAECLDEDALLGSLQCLGDLLIIHSTSGNSPNVLLAADAARAKGVRVLALSARDGGQLRTRVDHCVIVPTDRTDRAQELHLCIQHAICEVIEQTLT